MGVDIGKLPERYRRQIEKKLAIGREESMAVITTKEQSSVRVEPYESEEQAALFEWAEAMSGLYPCLRMLYHVPNGGHRSAATAGRLKAEGVKSGVPDICLPAARSGYHGLYIELKAGKNKATEGQKDWILALREEGYLALICRGWDKASKAILAYLNEKGKEAQDHGETL